MSTRRVAIVGMMPLYLMMSHPFTAEVRRTMDPVTTFAEKHIQWLGHATFKFTGSSVTVYSDPFNLTDRSGGATADIILVTHPHYDHLSPEDIARLRSTGTVVLAPDDPECRAKLSGNVRFMKPGDTTTVHGVLVRAVPAYNIGKNFHPKDKRWIGYIITIDAVRIYIAGDTDRIPEMKTFTADIALLPVGGTYTMSAVETAEAAQDINPKLAIPMHYGSVVGATKDAEKFRQQLSGTVRVIVKSAL